MGLKVWSDLGPAKQISKLPSRRGLQQNHAKSIKITADLRPPKQISKSAFLDDLFIFMLKVRNTIRAAPFL